MILKTHNLNDVIIHFSVLEPKCRKAQCWQIKKEGGIHWWEYTNFCAFVVKGTLMKTINNGSDWENQFTQSTLITKTDKCTLWIESLPFL